MKKPWEYEEPSCAEVGVEIFFARDMDDPKRKLGLDNYKEAKKICDACPHKMECAEWGIRYERHGMWGGLTPKDRTTLRRKLKIDIDMPTYRDY